MSRGSRCDEIPALVLEGIEGAFKKYSSWTLHKKWLDKAPELFVSVEIAQHLFKKLQHSSMDMECSVAEACRSSKRGRKPKSERSNGRFDILVSRESSGNPWCAIEVKSPVWSVSSGLVKDIQRIREVLSHRDHGGQIQCGAVAFYASVSPPKRKFAKASEAMASFRERLELRVRGELNGKSSLTYAIHHSKFHEGDDGDGWQAVCVFIKARKSRSRAIS